jgi:AraC-like DNA-binding protein
MSSLLRQFKMMFGKSIHQYYVEKKMELAKRMLLQERMTVKEIADRLGYKQASPFIDDFTRFHGYSPGRLKALRN